MSHVRLTPDEARRALYIDFEGRKGGPPVLLGCTTQIARPEPALGLAGRHRARS